MKRIKWICLSLAVLGLVFSFNLHLSAQPTTEAQVRYQVVERSQHQLHIITILHNSNYVVTPALSGELKLLSEFVQPDLKSDLKSKNAIAAINGGYFDPVNQKTTSFITINSQNVADPRFNQRLVDNPDLKRYLSKIFNRAEFRIYNCGEQSQYDIQPHFAPIPANCTLKGSLGGGPGLLPQDRSVAEAFTAYENGKKIRDAIGAESLNARSVIGITEAGDVILVMAAQQSDQPLSGISLPELANFLASKGAVKAMNLDGGSSASIYHDGKTIYGRIDQEGNRIQRPIKSALLVTPR